MFCGLWSVCMCVSLRLCLCEYCSKFLSVQLCKKDVSVSLETFTVWKEQGFFSLVSDKPRAISFLILGVAHSFWHFSEKKGT